MFIYSLSGLELKDSGQQAVEIEENETTARSATFQVFGKFFSCADSEHFDWATSGQWTKEIEQAVELLTFDFDPGTVPTPNSSQQEYCDEFTRLLGDSGLLLAGTHFDDAQQNLAEVNRFYEYFGLQTGDDAARAADHLSTQCDFMQFITFKEAASPSPRLGKSFRRAQLDFHDRQLSLWLPAFTEKAGATGLNPTFAWGVDRLAAFVAADHAYLKELQGA